MADLFAFICPACALAGGPFDRLAEAAQLAGTHDDLLHRGHPTASVVPADAGRWSR